MSLQEPWDDHDRCAVNWLVETPGADPSAGNVRWDPLHSLWNGGMAGVVLIAGPLVATPGALLLFVLTTGGGLLLGHSVGFHRLMIHRSFRTRVCTPFPARRGSGFIRGRATGGSY